MAAPAPALEHLAEEFHLPLRRYGPVGYLHLHSLQEIIELLLAPQGGHWTVPGHHHGFIRKGEVLVVDRAQNLVAIAEREIGAADAVTKERVAGHQFLFDRHP